MGRVVMQPVKFSVLWKPEKYSLQYKFGLKLNVTWNLFFVNRPLSLIFLEWRPSKVLCCKIHCHIAFDSLWCVSMTSNLCLHSLLQLPFDQGFVQKETSDYSMSNVVLYNQHVAHLNEYEGDASPDIIH